MVLDISLNFWPIKRTEISFFFKSKTLINGSIFYPLTNAALRPFIRKGWSYPKSHAHSYIQMMVCCHVQCYEIHIIMIYMVLDILLVQAGWSYLYLCSAVYSQALLFYNVNFTSELTPWTCPELQILAAVFVNADFVCQVPPLQNAHACSIFSLVYKTLRRVDTQ